MCPGDPALLILSGEEGDDSFTGNYPLDTPPLFDVPGIVIRGSGISDLETPASFKVVVWKDDAKNFPPNFANGYVGKTVCVTGMIEAYDDDASISAKDPSQFKFGC